MSSDGVLDASALLALVKGEPVTVSVLDVLPFAVISTVNLAEILTKVSELGLTHQANLSRFLGFLRGVVPFSREHARSASELRASTRHAGLSLGDRACLALALELGVPAYTTDRNWLRVDVGCQVICLR